MEKGVLLSKIIKFLNLDLEINEVLITKITTSINTNENSICWVKSVDHLLEVSNGVVICAEKALALIEQKDSVIYLPVTNPRLSFSKVVNHLFPFLLPNDFINHIEKHKQNKHIKIGENVFIGENVQIGDGTVILHNVVLNANTIIGKNCIINVGVSISTEGLGLEMDPETNLYVKFPQIGTVEIDDFVEIGPSSTIRRSALGTTKIGRGVKIGSLCNIGHNCIIGDNCLLTCNVVIAGSSIVGENVYFGVGSTIKNGLKIGQDSFIGQGAVVVKDVPKGETWVGNPAKKIK